MTISSPCTENFSKMPKSKMGRHCDLCNKTVIDFRQMDEAQIKDYFETSSVEPICGKFKNGQLSSGNTFEKFVLKFREWTDQRVKLVPLRLTILAFLSVIVTFMSSCMGKAIYKDERSTRENNKTIADTSQH